MWRPKDEDRSLYEQNYADPNSPDFEDIKKKNKVARRLRKRQAKLVLMIFGFYVICGIFVDYFEVEYLRKYLISILFIGMVVSIILQIRDSKKSNG